METRTGVLRIRGNESRLDDGTLLARCGEPNPLAAATAYLTARGFQSGDRIRVTGDPGTVGSVVVFCLITVEGAVAAMVETTRSGILDIVGNDSRLDDGTLLARCGAAHPFSDATSFITGRGFQKNDPIKVTGTDGTVGSVAVFCITAVEAGAAVAAMAATIAKPRKAKVAAKKKVSPKKKPARKRATVKKATRKSSKKKPRKRS
jgi:hypothetical protein